MATIARAGRFELRHTTSLINCKPTLWDIEIVYWIDEYCISVARFNKDTGEIQSVEDRLLKYVEKSHDSGNPYIFDEIRALETIARNIIALDEVPYNGN